MQKEKQSKQSLFCLGSKKREKQNFKQRSGMNKEVNRIDANAELPVAEPPLSVRIKEGEGAVLMSFQVINPSDQVDFDAIITVIPSMDRRYVGCAVTNNAQISRMPRIISIYIPKNLRNKNDQNQLCSCFMDAIDKAIKNNCRSVYFPAVNDYYSQPCINTAKIAEVAVAKISNIYPGYKLTIYFADSSCREQRTLPRQDAAGEVSYAMPFCDEQLSAAKEGNPKHEVQADSNFHVQDSSSGDDCGINESFNKNVESPTAAEMREKVGIEDRWVQGKPYRAMQVDGRYVLGEPSGSYYQTPFLAKQFGKNQHRQDVAADSARIGDLLLFGASFRGAMHYATATVRQDSFAIGAEDGEGEAKWAIAAIADGVSEAIQAHLLADYLTQQAIVLVKEKLGVDATAELKDIEWASVSRNLVMLSQEFCKRLSQDKLTLEQYQSRWASTLELVVVKAESSLHRTFVSVTIAGDGAVYVLDEKKGWNTIKSGKERTEGIVSNAVTALPADPGEPTIRFGTLASNEQMFITTDGLSDMIGKGDSSLGGFLQSELPKCNNLISYLHVMDVSMFQADDDRTGILIKENLP